MDEFAEQHSTICQLEITPHPRSFFLSRKLSIFERAGVSKVLYTSSYQRYSFVHPTFSPTVLHPSQESLFHLAASIKIVLLYSLKHNFVNSPRNQFVPPIYLRSKILFKFSSRVEFEPVTVWPVRVQFAFIGHSKTD